MHRVYISEIHGSDIFLSQEESRHLVKSLRLKINDGVELTDGRGTLAKSIIEVIDNHLVKLKVIEKINILPLKPYLHIAVAPTKNPDRLEWLIEKATEIGVNEVTPIICEHSEKTRVNSERLNRIMISALKQSYNLYLPKLNNLHHFDDLINKAGNCEQKLIAHCSSGDKKELATCLKKNFNTLILIGPEGDFSAKEIALAASHDFTAISLGNQRLRTETAALYSCAVFRAFNC